MTADYPSDLQGGQIRFKDMKDEEMNQYPTDSIAAPSGQNITTDTRETIRTASKAVPAKKLDGSMELETAGGIEGAKSPDMTIRGGQVNKKN